MSIILDASKTGRENFFDLLTISNPVAAHADGRVTVGLPVVDEVTQKTEVELVAIPGQGFIDSVIVSYERRVPVDASGTRLKGPVLVSPGDSQETILAKIIEHHGLVGDDVIITGSGAEGAFVIPTWAGEESEDFTYQIQAKPLSLIYQDIDGPFEGTFFSDNPYSPLDVAITVTDLGGFTEPE